MVSKTIFIDIDGTLRDYRIGVPISAHRALEKAKQAGHRLIICTGRTLCTIPTDVPLEIFDGIISGGGCRIDYMGKTLADKYLSHNIIGKYGKFFRENSIPFGYETDHGIFMNDKMAEFIGKLLSGGEDTEPDRISSERIVPEENMGDFDKELHHVSKLSFRLTEEQYKSFSISEEEHLKLIAFSEQDEGFVHCELIDADSGKGNGLKAFCELTGTDIAQTVAVGDSANDIEMFAAAGLSVCMGNAHPDVKKYADIITDELLDDGFYGGLCRAGLI